MSKWGRRIGLIGTGLALAGVWGAWVPHRSAALVLSGWDLAEFVRFVPGTSTTPVMFYLPAWCAGIALVLITGQSTGQSSSRSIVKSTARLGSMVIALGLMLAILPPYPHLMNGYQSAEFRGRFFLGVIGTLVILPSCFGQRWPVRLVGGALVTLAMVGVIPALWQFLKVRGAIEAVYGASLGWGWGPGLLLAGWGLVCATGWRMLARHNKGK